MIISVACNSVTFVRESLYFLVSQVMWFINSNGHDKENSSKSVFFEFLRSDRIVFFVRVIKCDHNGPGRQSRSLGQIMVQLIRKYSVIPAVVQHFYLNAENAIGNC